MNRQDWDRDMLYTCTSMYQQRYVDVSKHMSVSQSWLCSF